MNHIDLKDHYNIDDVMALTSAKGGSYFRELKNANILLTGGTGFFGVWLLSVFKYLNEQSKFQGEIYLITRDEASFFNANPALKNCDFIRIIQGDIKTVNLGEIQPDHLIDSKALDFIFTVFGEIISVAPRLLSHSFASGLPVIAVTEYFF